MTVFSRQPSHMTLSMADVPDLQGQHPLCHLQGATGCMSTRDWRSKLVVVACDRVSRCLLSSHIAQCVQQAPPDSLLPPKQQRQHARVSIL